MRITLYSNEPDNMVAVMDCGDWELHGDGELQMLYGAASEASYANPDVRPGRRWGSDII